MKSVISCLDTTGLTRADFAQLEAHAKEVLHKGYMMSRDGTVVYVDMKAHYTDWLTFIYAIFVFQFWSTRFILRRFLDKDHVLIDLDFGEYIAESRLIPVSSLDVWDLRIGMRHRRSDQGYCLVYVGEREPPRSRVLRLVLKWDVGYGALTLATCFWLAGRGVLNGRSAFHHKFGGITRLSSEPITFQELDWGYSWRFRPPVVYKI